MAFDPDAYLAGKETTAFDPDAYLAGKETTAFDPDAYLAGADKESFLQKLGRGVGEFIRPREIPGVSKPVQTIADFVSKVTEAGKSKLGDIGARNPTLEAFTTAGQGVLTGIGGAGQIGAAFAKPSAADVLTGFAASKVSIASKEAQALAAQLKLLRTAPVEVKAAQVAKMVQEKGQKAVNEAMSIAELEAKTGIPEKTKAAIDFVTPARFTTENRMTRPLVKPVLPATGKPFTLQAGLGEQNRAALEAFRAKLPQGPAKAPTLAPEAVITPKAPIPPIPAPGAPIPPITAQAPTTTTAATLKGVGSIKPRGFLETIETSNQTTPGLKERVLKINPQEYQELPNVEVLKSADDIIAIKGSNKALSDVMAVKNPSVEDTGIAMRLIKEYEGRGEYEKVVPLVDKFDSVFRESGRTVQLASLWNRLTPTGFVKTVENTIGKMGVTLDDDLRKMLAKNISKIRQMPDGNEKIEATFELLNSISDKIPLKAKIGNWINGYRYTNMLSNPLSQERNIFGNTVQTFVTRPLDMVGEWGYSFLKHPFNPISRDIKLLDIPKYYQSVFKTIPEAGQAFMGALRSNKISPKIAETLTGGGNIVEEAMRSNLPGVLKIIPNAMEGADRFFSVLIASGEKARLMRGGMSEDLAGAGAKKLAEKILYRQTLGGLTKNDSPLMVRALDELGRIALDMRKLPVLGKPASWFIPFVTTPINIAKAGVERSPLALLDILAGRKYSDAEMGKVLVGSAVMLTGAIMAQQGKVTWLAPRDKKGKQAFYNSGRVPMSVEIGGKYIPMQYFGPLALPFMLPEALHYQLEESKQALTQDNITSISKAILSAGRLVTEQTPLAGISDFTDIMSGDEKISAKILARPIGQIIPFSGALRFVANIVDPIIRKGNGLIDELKKNIPGLTKDLDFYEDKPSVPSKRNLSAQYAPYNIGTKNETENAKFEWLTKINQRKAVIEKRKKIFKDLLKQRKNQ